MTHSAHNKAQDIGQPIAETIEQADDSIEELEVYEDNIQVQDPNKQVKSHLLQPPEHVDTRRVPDPGASETPRSQRAFVLNLNDSFHLSAAPSLMKDPLLPSTSIFPFTLKNTKIKIASLWRTVSRPSAL
jgi:hypothetical protein